MWDPTLGPDSTREKEKASVDPSSLPVVVINDSDVETTINFLVAQRAKNLLAMWETRFDPWVRKIPRRREWPPTPLLLPGESHGQRSLAGCSPWGHKESDTTERLTCLQAL